MWWGVGNAIGGLLGRILSLEIIRVPAHCLSAWPLITTFSCPADATPVTCSSHENMGWRYQYILVGGLCLVLACLRIFFMTMEESTKWLVAQGRFDEAVEGLRRVAHINKSEMLLSAEDFQPVQNRLQRNDTPGSEKHLQHIIHLRGLFATRKMSFSMIGVIVLWMSIGIAYVNIIPP